MQYNVKMILSDYSEINRFILTAQNFYYFVKINLGRFLFNWFINKFIQTRLSFLEVYGLTWLSEIKSDKYFNIFQNI